jgi:hypothetical protein
MTQHTINLPDSLNPRTQELVVKFAEVLGRKLQNAEKRYGHKDEWANDDWERDCKEALIEHIKKGDPRDVAAYCAFMWYHGWKTSLHVTVDIGA